MLKKASIALTTLLNKSQDQTGKTLLQIALDQNNEAVIKFDAICQKIRDNDPSCVDITFTDFQLRDNGAVRIASALQCNTHLQSVNLSKQVIGDAGFIALCKALFRHPLRVLDLGHNELTDKVSAEVVSLLEQNHLLQQLNLSHNRFSISHLSAILLVALKHPSLTTIELTCQRCEKLYFNTELSKALAENVSLQRLNLENIDVSDYCFLGNYLKINTTLLAFSMKSFNRMHQIKLILERNQHYESEFDRASALVTRVLQLLRAETLNTQEIFAANADIHKSTQIANELSSKSYANADRLKLSIQKAIALMAVAEDLLSGDSIVLKRLAKQSPLIASHTERTQVSIVDQIRTSGGSPTLPRVSLVEKASEAVEHNVKKLASK